MCQDGNVKLSKKKQTQTKTQLAECPCYLNLSHCVSLQLRLHYHVLLFPYNLPYTQQEAPTEWETLWCFALNPLFNFCSGDNIQAQCQMPQLTPAVGRCDCHSHTQALLRRSLCRVFLPSPTFSAGPQTTFFLQDVTKLTRPQGTHSPKVTPKWDMCRWLTLKLLLHKKGKYTSFYDGRDEFCAETPKHN